MLNSRNNPSIVCLTGGMGSGKTTAARLFEDLGVGVYYADQAAKILMEEDLELRASLIELLGQRVYNKHGQLNRQWIAQKLFNNSELLNLWNAKVHPKVFDHFNHWVHCQEGPYILKEAAILFETGGQRNCDLSILITAPEDLRIERVMKRDSWTREQVQARLKKQWPDEKKMPLADFIIENLDLRTLSIEIERLHSELTQRFSKQ